MFLLLSISLFLYYSWISFQSPQYFPFFLFWIRMNCLLLRELPLKCIVRLWDTYLSEETGGFENFHVYVCAVLLKTYKEKLIEMVRTLLHTWFYLYCKILCKRLLLILYLLFYFLFFTFIFLIFIYISYLYFDFEHPF